MRNLPKLGTSPNTLSAKGLGLPLLFYHELYFCFAYPVSYLLLFYRKILQTAGELVVLTTPEAIS